MQYWRRRSLRDLYFDKTVKDSVSDAEAKKFYDAQVGGAEVEDEVRARHILVDSKEKARELFEKVAYGTDFAELAKQNSKDPGSKDQGGDLGYFSRGQMVPQFEEAAFKLQKGEVSQPFETQFGWHILKVDDRRAGQARAVRGREGPHRRRHHPPEGPADRRRPARQGARSSISIPENSRRSPG